MINGKITSQLQNLKSLENLNLSHNNLLGRIPTLPIYRWSSIDLSYNDLEGHIPIELQLEHHPKVFSHKKGLCGEIKGWTHCRRGHKIIRIIVIAISTILFLFATFGFLLLLQNTRQNQTKTTSTKNGDIFSIWNYDGNIAYEDIIEATKDFDVKYCIGTKGYGNVYRAQLPTGNVIALKKFHG